MLSKYHSCQYLQNSCGRQPLKWPTSLILMPCFWVWAGLDSLLITEYDQSRGRVTKNLWLPSCLFPCYELPYGKCMRQKLTLWNTDSPGLRPPLPTPQDTTVPADGCIWTPDPQGREITSVCSVKLKSLGAICYTTRDHLHHCW